MGMKKPYMDIISDVEATEELLKWNMCGSLCTVNDVILKDIELQQLHLGDCIVFKKCGAYSVTEGMAKFLSRELPQILFYSKDDGLKTVRKRIGTDVFNTSQED
jgi:diaminopimelate decarboxylase